MLTLPDVDVEHWRRFHLAGDRTPLGPETETFKRWERVRALSSRSLSMQAHEIDTPALRERQRGMAPILTRARDVLSTAVSELANRGLTVVLADHDGVILASWGSDRLLGPRYRGAFAVGACWDEATRGTNGIGTALAERRPVAVVGRSHYLEESHGLACYAAPIENPHDGSVVILDVTASAASADPLLGVLIEALAATLEGALLADAGQTPAAQRSNALEARILADQNRVLAEASARLGASLDLDETLDAIAWLALDAFADVCVIDLVGDDGRLARARVRTHLGDSAAIAEVAARERVEVRRPAVQLEAIEQRRPILIRAVGSERAALVSEPVIRELTPSSLIAVPMLSGERVVGTLLFVSVTGLHYGAHHVRLAEQLGRRAALAVANAQLHQRVHLAASSRADVLAMVAHDLRGPLSTIGLSSELLRGRLEGDPEDLSVRAIIRSAQRMNRLIEDLLDASRSTSDRLGLVTKPTPAGSLLEDAVEIARTLARNRPIHVESGALPAVEADGERVLQVLTNLLGNAVKFTPDGSAITLGARVEGAAVRFWVRDRGPGLSAEQLEHVFERFWKGQRGDRRGVGLGLFISKRIIEDHGGQIGAESAPGAGSSFYFTLPIAASAGR